MISRHHLTHTFTVPTARPPQGDAGGLHSTVVRDADDEVGVAGDVLHVRVVRGAVLLGHDAVHGKQQTHQLENFYNHRYFRLCRSRTTENWN